MDDLPEILTEDFVDREDELNLLWQLARGRLPQRVCVVSGPDGIGKTYLLQEFSEECAAHGLVVGRVMPDLTQNLNAMNIVLRLWEDLELGDVGELYHKVALGRAERHIQYVPAPEVSGKQVAVSVSGPPSFYGPVITGKVIGNVETVLELSLNDDPASRREVQAVVTPFLKERLAASCQSRQVVLVLDSWDRVRSDTETGGWLKGNLFRWVLEGDLPGTVLVICGVSQPEFTSLPMRLQKISLSSLPDEAVRAYWVEKCELPPVDVPVVTQITNGIPQALYMTAKNTLLTKNQPSASSQNPSLQSGTEQVTRFALQGLLQALPSDFSLLIRLCAWTHWFDRELFDLLAVLAGCSKDTFEQLVILRFVHQDETGFYYFDPSVRHHLLEGWIQSREMEVPAQAFTSILQYFEGLRGKVSRRQNWEVEKEILYFKLLVDQDQGIGALSEHFEKAVRLQQYGLAEQYLQHISDLGEILSKSNLLWLRYFQARLKTVYSQDDKLASEIDAITAETPDPILQAACLWLTGSRMLEEQQWSRATNLYNDSLRLMKRDSRKLYTMLVTLSQAEVYRDLVRRLGGFQSQSIEQVDSRLMKFLSTIQHFPYLLYEWCVHHIRFLPNWYFGTNYQDWILYYLLMESGRWYQHAIRSAPDGDSYWTFEIQLGLANVEHQLGRWARAQKHYADLLDLDLVQENPYRKGLVLLGQGEALTSEGKLSQGMTTLQACGTFFAGFHVEKLIGDVYGLLGRIHLKLGQTAQAVDSLLTGIQAYTNAGDRISATELLDILADRASQVDQPDQKQAVEDLLQTTQSRSYITRFPDRLLSWYRKVAMYGAMPLTYLVLIFLSFASGLILNALEGEFLFFQRGISLGTTLRDVIIILITIMLPVPISLWLYRFFYSLIGVIVVYILGRRLVPLEKEQPRDLDLNSDAMRIMLSDGSSKDIAWDEISRVGIESVCLIEHEINLVSRTILVLPGKKPEIIEGVTSGYKHFKNELKRRLQTVNPSAETIPLTFRILAGRWIAAVILFTTLVTSYLWLTGRIQGAYIETISGGQVYTFVGPIATVFLPTFTLTFVAVSLWRFMFHSSRLRKRLSISPTTFPVWVRWFTALLASLLALGWLLVFFL